MAFPFSPQLPIRGAMAAMSGIGVSLATTARDMRTCPAAVQPAPAVIRRVHRPRRLTTRVHAGCVRPSVRVCALLALGILSESPVSPRSDGLPETALERALRYKRDKATGQTQTTVDPTPKPPIPPPNADWANPAAVQTASGKVESRLASRTVDLEDAANTSGVYNPIRAEGAALQTQEEEDEEDNLESSMQELAAKAEATNQRAEQALAAALEYSKQKRDEKGLTEDDTKGLSMEALTEKLDDVSPVLSQFQSHAPVGPTRRTQAARCGRGPEAWVGAGGCEGRARLET